MKTGRGKEKQRDIEKRKRKSTFLFAAEGNNVTEKNYFKAMNSDRVHVIFTKGNETDPVKLMNRLIEESKNLDPELGDRAFCLVDADVNPVKDQQIADADNAARKTLAVQIVSNRRADRGRAYRLPHTTKPRCENCVEATEEKQRECAPSWDAFPLLFCD